MPTVSIDVSSYSTEGLDDGTSEMCQMRLMTVTDGHGSAYIPGQSIPRVKPVSAAQSEHRDAHPNSEQERAKFLQSRDAHQPYQQSGGQRQQCERMIYAHEPMTSPVAMISPKGSLNHVWTLMCQHRFRHFPVPGSGRPVV